MKRKLKIKAYSNKSKLIKNNILKNNQKLIILTFLFIIGLLLGASCVKNSNEFMLDRIKELIDAFFLKKTNQSILKNFSSFFLSDMLFIIISAACGLCIIGEPAIWALPFIRGLGIGAITGYLYNNFNINGFMFSLLYIIIPSTISVSFLIICCKENILSQKELRQKLNNQSTESGNQYLKLFAVRNLIISAFTSISALAGSLLIYLLGNKISI